eukprot:CAMPEP_0202810568 /NCGR_PEP_ID=MMETSP1389-20130828/2622_1 /ASSEMBLY_ACC=CAM_ASM_000865 /TAXON_ID=302021 /ORGANISM="Rhodomonas sp., Strain CCMP768" /LENGTH=42 /DNA_ID= /DNA_START= /DNA_END= /DNA_ORIENTATION=
MLVQLFKMPNASSLAKKYQSHSTWLKQLDSTLNGEADTHEDY